jgi:hypothetical protein
VERVPGGHEEFTTEPYVERLAEVIGARLDRSGAPSE